MTNAVNKGPLWSFGPLWSDALLPRFVCLNRACIRGHTSMRGDPIHTLPPVSLYEICFPIKQFDSRNVNVQRHGVAMRQQRQGRRRRLLKLSSWPADINSASHTMRCW